jgi:hypothetical protein
MSTTEPSRFLSDPGRNPPATDLHGVAEWFTSQKDALERFRWTLRDSLDELLDGQRTGRWAYGHLTKTERTHLGTVVEVNLTKEFGIQDGQHLDWHVAGEDLDCKFSKDLGGWEIPMEMYLCADHEGRSGIADHPALLVWMNDDTNEWAAGLLRMSDMRLRWKKHQPGGLPERAYNRDNKRRIGDGARDEIHWLWGRPRADLPPNVLLQMSPATRAEIFADTRSGQKRVDALFTLVQEQIVGRAVVLTVAQQEDAPKRARDARLHLRSSGIVVLGHQENHPLVAAHLGLDIPEKGEWISARLIRVPEYGTRRRVWIGEYSNAKTGERSAAGWWAIARPHEPEEPGPIVVSAVAVRA